MKTSPRKLALAFAVALSCIATQTHAQQNDVLYQDLGGKDGIARIVNDFVPMIVNDPRIKQFFENADTERLALMLTEQFCQISGGPCKYSGRDMHAVHESMGVNTANFNALAEDLQQAMENNHVSSRVANQLVARLAPMKSAIVTK